MLIGIGLLCCLSTSAQFRINDMQVYYDKNTNSYLASISEKYWETDYPATITLEKGSGWDELMIDGQKTLEDFVFQNISNQKKYQLSWVNEGVLNTSSLQFTFLPIVLLTGDFGYEYSHASVNLQMPDKSTEKLYAEIKWRGGSTNTDEKHKKNYKIKFVDQYGNKQDHSFFSLRNDNVWILDAGQVDLFRVRNLIASEIWNEFATKPYYGNNNKDVHTASRGQMVEVFLNNQYQGIYNMCEPIDRKQLQLKKYDSSGTIHGGLWKATGWGIATFCDVPPVYDNTSPTWREFEVKYPEIDDLCPSDYSTLYDAINFVATSTDQEFAEQITSYIDLPVFLDFCVFTNVLNLFDNCGKNIYWAVYDKQKDKKLTPAMWDLDVSVGQNYTDDSLHLDYVAYNAEPLTLTNIAYRIYELKVGKIYETFIQRYHQLREGIFSCQQLTDRYYQYYNIMKKSGAAQREEKRWSGDSDISFLNLDFDREISYIIDWIKHRLDYLDFYFNNDMPSASINELQHTSKGKSVYSLFGTKISPAYRGIVIIDGKKVFVK